MKTRVFLGILVSVLFFACNQEESIEEIEAVNVGVSITPFVCDPDWRAPIAPQDQSGVKIHITYDENLTPDEINCIRQEYFSEQDCLKMYFFQPQNPYHDIWFVVFCSTGAASTAQTVENTIKNDPQVCGAPPSECN